jgi:hypothetical protein
LSEKGWEIIQSLNSDGVFMLFLNKFLLKNNEKLLLITSQLNISDRLTMAKANVKKPQQHEDFVNTSSRGFTKPSSCCLNERWIVIGYENQLIFGEVLGNRGDQIIQRISERISISIASPLPISGQRSQVFRTSKANIYCSPQLGEKQ